MIRLFSPVLLLFLVSCVTFRDEVARILQLAQAPEGRTTGTTGGLYEQASMQSEMLATIEARASVQVLDSASGHFFQARMSKDGKTFTGYMYKACIAGR